MSYFSKQRLKSFISYKSLIASIVLSNIFLPFRSVTAKPIVYSFTVNVVEGTLQGKTFNGFFSYDDEKLLGNETEILGINDGLKVCMNFFDQLYTEKNDVDYPSFPQLTLKEGQPEILDFWIEPAKRRLWWNLNGWNVELSQVQENQTINDCQ